MPDSDNESAAREMRADEEEEEESLLRDAQMQIGVKLRERDNRFALSGCLASGVRCYKCTQ